MALQRWQFYDPATGTFTFSMNPNSGGTRKYEKTITEIPTTAADGQPLIFEGADSPSPLEFSGITHLQSDLNALVTWFSKHRQIRLTDDLGRQFWIYITELEATRKRSYQHPWKHDFRMSAVILDWP